MTIASRNAPDGGRLLDRIVASADICRRPKAEGRLVGAEHGVAPALTPSTA